jgi:acyl carrier protein
MAKTEEYDNIFIRLFDVKHEQLPTLEYQSIETWDSVGHMSLIVSLEEAFGITFEMDDILDFSSYSKGIEILRKYSVEL